MCCCMTGASSLLTVTGADTAVSRQEDTNERRPNQCANPILTFRLAAIIAFLIGFKRFWKTAAEFVLE